MLTIPGCGLQHEEAEACPPARRHLPGPTEDAPPCAAAQPLFAGRLPAPVAALPGGHAGMQPTHIPSPPTGRAQEPTLVSASTHAFVTLSLGRGRINRRVGAAGRHPPDKVLSGQGIHNQVQEGPADIAEQVALCCAGCMLSWRLRWCHSQRAPALPRGPPPLLPLPQLLPQLPCSSSQPPGICSRRHWGDIKSS